MRPTANLLRSSVESTCKAFEIPKLKQEAGSEGELSRENARGSIVGCDGRVAEMLREQNGASRRRARIQHRFKVRLPVCKHPLTNRAGLVHYPDLEDS